MPTERPSDRLAALQSAVRAFNKARSWRKFHAPKNLSMALAIEAAELMEHFRWMTPARSWKAAREEPTASHVRDEMADVLLVLLSLADYLQIDLVAAAEAKLRRNGEKYPEAESRGRSEKYTAYTRG